MGCGVLLVDDEDSIRDSIGTYLSDKDYEVRTAATVDEALRTLEEFLPGLLIVDLQMPGKDGFLMIQELRKRNNSAAIIVISGHGNIEKAVEATKMGASRFLEKPFSLCDLEQAVEQTLRDDTCGCHLLRLDRDGFRMEGQGWSLIGISDAMKDVYRKILLVAQNTSSTVLVQGESGTGKELVARAIFESGRHPKGKFIDVNCAALSESLLEAELFGHEKGAFTGAIQTRKGLFEAADGGVIFLDEIGEMPLRLQAKLLRVLEEKAFKRVGGVENIKVNLRVIASTNRDIAEMVKQGEFRRDLYYRLDVFTIGIPPLRERPSDVPLLCAHFLKVFSRACKKHLGVFSSDAMARLQQYEWPGNVRELRNVIERGVILGSGRTVYARDLAIPKCETPHICVSSPLPIQVQSLEGMERELIGKVLEETGGQRARAAEILGINRTTLWHKIKRYGLDTLQQSAAAPHLPARSA